MAQQTEAQERPPQNPPSSQPQEHKPPQISERDLKWKQFRSRNPRFRMFLIIGLVVLVVAGFFLWRYFNSYESTDDAQIDGHLNPVSARVGGHVLKLLVNDNDYVKAGQPLVQIDPRDYEVLVSRAKADYDDAVATAKAAGVNVPITSTATSSQLATAEAEVGAAQATLAAARQQYDAANAQVAQAEANNVKAQNDLARYKQLVSKQEISQQQYDQAYAAAQAGGGCSGRGPLICRCGPAADQGGAEQSPPGPGGRAKREKRSAADEGRALAGRIGGSAGGKQESGTRPGRVEFEVHHDCLARKWGCHQPYR